MIEETAPATTAASEATTSALNASAPAEQTNLISIQDVMKVELKVGLITSAERVKNRTS